MYPCDGPGSGASWSLAENQFQSGNIGGFCLGTDKPNASASMFVLDEFGNGELTIYGSFVTDHCLGVCEE